MNNFNIYLEIQNLKKQAIRYEIRVEGLLPDELVNQREEQRNGEPPDRQLDI